MTDRECVELLQWALPQLGLRWPGFRKVRRQVHKRIVRRLDELGLTQVSGYRDYLQTHSSEWAVLDGLARISISRFYRDRDVYDHLRDELLPDLARMTHLRGESSVHVWSAGCASGEEPYTLAIVWRQRVQPKFPDVSLRLIATDADAHLLQRARKASYPASSLKDLPAPYQAAAFVRSQGEYTLRPDACGLIEFRKQDLRTEVPTESFHLVLCRNLVFTYFAEAEQRRMGEQFAERLLPGGFLVIGKHETIPQDMRGILPHDAKRGIYRAVR